MPTLDPVYWISVPISPSWGTKTKFIIPLIPWKPSWDNERNMARYLPDDVNPTNEKYYTPSKVSSPNINIANDIAHSLSTVAYNRWRLSPFETQPIYFYVDPNSLCLKFYFETSCTELPPDSWDSYDPLYNIELANNGFNKWETHYYRMVLSTGLGGMINTDFSNDGQYIQKYSTSGTPCHGEGSPEPTPLQPSPTPIPSTLSYYKPTSEGLVSIVGFYNPTYDPDNPSMSDIEALGIITNVNHPQQWEWNYYMLYGWEDFVPTKVDDPDNPDPPQPTEDDMKINKPWLGSFFNRVYACKRDHVTALATYVCDTVAGNITDLDGFLTYINSMWGGFSGWLDSVIDVCIFPFSVPNYVDGGTSHPTTSVRFSASSVMDSSVVSANWDVVNFSANLYQLLDGTDCLFDATGWFQISRKFNDFRDFPPYRKSVLYIPFVGNVEFNLHNYYGKYMKIKYAVDVMNGGCRAFICIASSNSVSDDGIIVASFDGQMGVHVPVTKLGYSDYFCSITNALGNTISGSVSAGMNMASGGAKIKGVKTAIGGAITSGGITEGFQSIAELNKAESNVPFSTSGSSSPSLSQYSDWICRVIWYEMTTRESSNLLQLHGYASNKSGALNSFSGFLSVASCKLSCPKATEKEREMIMRALTEGIYI